MPSQAMGLFANGINMEQNSDLVHAGKLIHEEIEIDGTKVTFETDFNRTIRN